MSQSTNSEEVRGRRSLAQERSRAHTRQRLLSASDALFRERGYTATTVNAIAAGAEVSLQTLYLAWGSKRALFRAAADAASTATTPPPDSDQWRAAVRGRIAGIAGEDGDARAHIAAVVEVFAQLARHASVYWGLYLQAAAAEPEVAEEWRLLAARRRETCSWIAQAVPLTGLRAELSPTAVTDTIWAIASPETYLMLTRDGGYDEEGVATFLTTTLTNALCAPIEQTSFSPTESSAALPETADAPATPRHD